MRPYWSYSSVQQYLRCPLQYYFERILRLPRPFTSSSLVFGSVLHDCLAEYHFALQSERQWSLEEVQELFSESWNLSVADEDVEFKSGESDKSLQSLGREMLKLYFEQPPPQKIVAVEERLMVPLVNSQQDYLETPLVAFADLLVESKEGIKIIEFKTSQRAYGKSEVSLSLQATCYVHACHQEFGNVSEVEYQVFVKNKKPKLQNLTTQRNETQFQRLGDIVENVQRAVELKIFYPNASPQNCTGCAYQEACENWKSLRHPTQEQEVDLVCG